MTIKFYDSRVFIEALGPSEQTILVSSIKVG